MSTSRRCRSVPVDGDKMRQDAMLCGQGARRERTGETSAGLRLRPAALVSGGWEGLLFMASVFLQGSPCFAATLHCRVFFARPLHCLTCTDVVGGSLVRTR